MAIIKLIGTVWLVLLVLFILGTILGVYIEQKLNESHPLKKWWRKHIVAPDPYDNDWKNFGG